MTRYLFILIFALLASDVFAQSTVNVTATDTSTNQRTQVGSSVARAIRQVLVDSSGNIFGTTTNPVLIGGPVASGAADSGNPVKVGCVYNSSVITLSNGNRGDCQADVNGFLKVNLGQYTANGDGGFPVHLVNGGSGGTSAADNAAFTQGTTSETPIAGFNSNGDGGYTGGTTGHNVIWQMTPKGHGVVDVGNGSATATDAATQNGGTASVALAIALAQGYDPIQAKYERMYLDPCQGNQKSWVAISQTGNTQILGLSGASKKYYICSIQLVSATAQNIAIVDSTTAGNACATSPSAVLGLTASTAATGWNFAANGGIAFGSGSNAVGQTTDANAALCVMQSGSGQLSGGFSYVSQ